MMKIDAGLSARQVLQRRGRRGGADVTGTCNESCRGPVLATVSRRGETLNGFAKRRVGSCRNGVWHARLRGIPVGGKYNIRFSAGEEEQVTVRQVLVGDVWFLAGQSNMEGAGCLADAAPPHPMVHAFYHWDEWRNAREPLHILAAAVDPVHAETPLTGRRAIEAARRNATHGVGPGLMFARDMFEATGVPQGLVACAHGGTCMDQWSPALRDQGGSSLYGAMYRRFRKLGQAVAGVLWYQGESDAGRLMHADYTDKMKTLVAGVRRDFEQPDLPWVVVQIGPVVAGEPVQPWWLSIREQQRLLPDRIDRLSVVSAIDLGLGDFIHLNGQSQQVLGKRLARAMRFQTHCRGPAKAKDGIRIKELRLVDGPDFAPTYTNVIEVLCENVAGRLSSGAREPRGFRILGPDGQPERVLFNTRLAGDRLYIVHGIADPASLPGYSLVYGYELDPACNITDTEGMALPAFGPLPLTP